MTRSAKLSATVIPVSELTRRHRRQMFEAMQRTYEGMDADAFARDLDEKQWAVVLTPSRSDRIVGFSTLALLSETMDGRIVRAFYSGDTVVDHAYWGSLALEKAWLRFVFSHVDHAPRQRWYWLLVCKGFRTYRYLPVYFHHHYPCPGGSREEPERTLLSRLARRRFGACYDAETGTIRYDESYRLRHGISDITAAELHDPRIAFFQDRNPGWRNGEELACLTELSHENLRPVGRRVLRARQVQDHVNAPCS